MLAACYSTQGRGNGTWDVWAGLIDCAFGRTGPVFEKSQGEEGKRAPGTCSRVGGAWSVRSL